MFLKLIYLYSKVENLECFIWYIPLSHINPKFFHAHFFFETLKIGRG
jgi:hypothetical protein